MDLDKIEALAKRVCVNGRSMLEVGEIGADRLTFWKKAPEILALIARLRAAERVCEAANGHRKAAVNSDQPWDEYFARTDELDRELDAWLKTREQP